MTRDLPDSCLRGTSAGAAVPTPSTERLRGTPFVNRDAEKMPEQCGGNKTKLLIYHVIIARLQVSIWEASPARSVLSVRTSWKSPHLFCSSISMMRVQLHNKWMDDKNVPTNARNRYLPPIVGRPANLKNMKKCHEVEVIRS